MLLNRDITMTIRTQKSRIAGPFTAMALKAVIGVAVFAACLLPALHQAGAQQGGAIMYEWGSDFDKIKRMVSSGMTVEQFTPVERPKYKNTVLKYILASDGSLAESIIILRVKTVPVTDYLFIKSKLYTIVEEWDPITDEEAGNIRARLDSSYGSPQSESDKGLTIFSYDLNAVSVRYYLLKLESGRNSCKVYFYPSDLFKMLMKQ